jgi:transcriptional regulator with XRE-family HTH domain
MEINRQKLDLDLIRKILLYVERFSPSEPFVLEGFSDTEISNQIEMLQAADYVGYKNVSENPANEMTMVALVLTEKGRHFLDLFRDETIWSKIIRRYGDRDLSLGDVESIAEEISEQNNIKQSGEINVESSPVIIDHTYNSAPLPTGDKILGKKIRQFRAERGWSQRELSDHAVLSSSFISKVENGVVGAGKETIQRLAAALEVPPEVLTEGTPYADMLVHSSSPASSQPDEPDDTPPPSPDNEQQTEEELRTVQIGTVGDQPTKDDKLGFTPYVEAIAKFLMDEKTKGPLTLSIEGEWGSGKSSFMLQIEEKLEKINKDILTVHFNAWRYDKEDALWAAFATKVVKELNQKAGWRKRLKAKFALFRCRFDWKKGWFSFLSLGLVAISLFFLAALLINNYLRNPSDFAPLGGLLAQALSKDGADVLIRFLTITIAGYIILYVLVLRKINEFLINPLTTDFKKHLKAPDYRQRATFLDEFHEDFSKIIEAYAGKGDKAQRVFVFIDDLDRCDVPKSAELMQALNLMLSENPQLYFIIGMDREKVAAGIAVKHEKLLEYLVPASAAGAQNANPKLEYGFEFIEKFIQVPFKVPQARPDDIENLIAELSGREKKQAAQIPAKILDEPVEDDSIKFSIGSVEDRIWVTSNVIDEASPVRQQEKTPPKQEDVDSSEIDKVIKTVGPFFDYNPRRIKQFLNIYRLKIYIGNETGLFNHPPEGSGFKRINLHKLGKFVAIDLRYPMLIAELDDNPRLLEELQKLALGEIASTEVSSDYWAGKLRLTKLLKAKIEQDLELPGFYEKYGLVNINIGQLLQISPATKTLPAAAAENSPPAGESAQ